ncbi:MAG: hypothetical protein AAF696_08685 [Bacteroidota bacterium]
MELLTRIGLEGEKALIGLEYDCQQKSFLLIRIRKKKGKLSMEERRFFEEAIHLQNYLKQWPGLMIVLKLKNAGYMDKWVEKSHPDKLYAILGIEVENRQDFIWEEIQAEGKNILISLIRKEAYLEATTALGQSKSRIIACFLNDAASCFLIPNLNNYQENLSYQWADRDHFVWHKGISPYGQTDKMVYPQQLAKEFGLEENTISLYASCLLFYLKGLQNIKGIQGFEQNQSRQLKELSYLRYLCLAVCALMSIFLFFKIGQSYLSSHISSKTSFVFQHQDQWEAVNQRESSWKAQRSSFHKHSKDGKQHTQLAWYTDQIASKVPHSLGLNRIIYKARKEQIKKIDPELDLRAFDLLIQGESPKSTAIAQFVKKLDMLTWTKKAELFQTEFSYRENKHHFTLLIELKDEN